MHKCMHLVTSSAMGLINCRSSSIGGFDTEQFHIVRDELHDANPEAVKWFEKLDGCLFDKQVRFKDDCEECQMGHSPGECVALREGWEDAATPTDVVSTTVVSNGGHCDKIVRTVYKLADEDASISQQRNQSAVLMMTPKELLKGITDGAIFPAIGKCKASPKDPLPHSLTVSFQMKSCANEQGTSNSNTQMDQCNDTGEFSDNSSDDGASNWVLDTNNATDVYVVHTFWSRTSATTTSLHHGPKWSPHGLGTLRWVYSRWYTLKYLTNGASPSMPPDLTHQHFRNTLEDLDLRNCMMPVEFVASFS